MFAASSSAASWRFHLLRRFWNQIFTCVSVSRREAARPARSVELRYLVDKHAINKRFLTREFLFNLLPFEIKRRFQLEHLSSRKDGPCLLLAFPVDPFIARVIAARWVQRGVVIIAHIRILFVGLLLVLQVR